MMEGGIFQATSQKYGKDKTKVVWFTGRKMERQQQARRNPRPLCQFTGRDEEQAKRGEVRDTRRGEGREITRKKEEVMIGTGS